MAEIDKTLRELSQLGREIELEEAEVNTKKGKRDSLYDQLRNEFDLKSIEEAQKHIKVLEVTITRKNEFVDKKMAELKEIYEF